MVLLSYVSIKALGRGSARSKTSGIEGTNGVVCYRRISGPASGLKMPDTKASSQNCVSCVFASRLIPAGESDDGNYVTRRLARNPAATVGAAITVRALANRPMDKLHFNGAMRSLHPRLSTIDKFCGFAVVEWGTPPGRRRS